MRPRPAEDHPRIAPLALVLGPRSTAELIARGLQAEGFDVEFESDLPAELPSCAEPDAISGLRHLLGAFAERTGGAPVPGCIHPGASPWADRPELTQIGQEFGLSVVGAPLRLVSFFSSKLSLLTEAESLGIPNLLLSSDPISNARELTRILERRSPGRLPVVVKSARGGASDVLVLHHPEDLEKRLALWMEQLRKKYGEVILLAERYLESARQVSVPFVRLRDGSFRTFPLIDGSLQSRHRRIIEFCPPPALDSEAAAKLLGWTGQLAESLNFLGVGQLEFLTDGLKIYLVDGIARLARSFPLWERAAGTSAVSWQIQAQMDVRMMFKSDARRLDRNREPAPHGICLHLYAEDPLLQLPQPGLVHEKEARTQWQFPGADAQAILPVEQGTSVSSHEGLLGQLFVAAQTQEHALTVAQGALDEIWLAGSLQTNERFLSELLQHPWVREGMFHAGFVDEEFIPEVRPNQELLTLFATICSELKSTDGMKGRWAVGDQWVRPNVEALRWVGTPKRLDLPQETGISGMVELSDGRRLRVCAYPLREARWLVRIGKWCMSVRYAQPQRGGPKKLVSLVSGTVHSIHFREGTTATAHEPLLIVDSLQSLVPHAVPIDVRVLRWHVRPEQTIQAGEDLAELEVVAARG